jgi:hypothetical protein
VKRKPDFIFMACTSANVSYRESLTKSELVHALRSGEVPQNRRAHLRTLLEEAPEVLLKGLIEQVSESMEPGELEKNLLKIAEALDPSRQILDRVETVCYRREQS